MDAHADARRLRVGVVWNLVPVFLLALVGLGLNFAIGRFWGPAALGAFNQVTAAYFVLAALGSVGINFSVLRAVAAHQSDPARVSAVVVGGLVPSIGLGLLVAGGFFALRRPIAELLSSSAVEVGVLWASPGLFCFIVNKVLLGVVNGLSRMRAFAVYTSLRYLLIALGLGLGLWLELPPEALPGIWTFSEGVLLLVLLVELVLTVSLGAARGWGKWLREHVVYGLRGFLAVLLFEINSRLDIWMLGPRFSDTVVGVYSMAASMAEGASQLPVVLQVNVNPKLAADLAAGRHADVHALIARTRRWFVPAMAALSALAVLLYPLVIPWLTAHGEFGDGALPFALLMGGLVMSAPWLPYNQILLMGSKPGWHTVYVAVGVATNVIGCWLLIPHYGPLGAAASTAASLLFAALLLRRMAALLLGVKL